MKSRKDLLKASAATFAVMGASIVGLQTAAFADVRNCVEIAGNPTFGTNDLISGEYASACSPNASGTMYGRIKEDRNLQPDATHDTESIYFTGDGDQSTVDTVTCQNGDAIYIEADISGLSGSDESERREMSC